jgi:prefoldin subunit 5
MIDLSDFDREFLYLRDYARQHGDTAALRIAADEIVKLRGGYERLAEHVQHEEGTDVVETVIRKIAELEAELDALKARLAECEAGAAMMRAALEDVDALHQSVTGQANERGDNLTPMQVWERVRAALSSDAGRSLLERIRELEEENTSLHAHITHLEAEVDRHRERANSAQIAWETHQATDCALQCCREIEEIIGTSDPVEAVKILRNWRKRLGDD